MNAEPSYALQKAVYLALSSDLRLAGLVSTRIFDRVPPGTALPLIHVGDDQIIADYSSGRFFECHCQVHVFDGGPGRTKLKQIIGGVVAVLDTQLTLDGFLCCEARFDGSHTLTEADGVTEHAIVEFYYLVEAKP